MRTLVIEDNHSTARSIEMMLARAEFIVYTAALGTEGAELAKLYEYDLILLDLNLPDMNGHSVLRNLRLSRIETPVLVLSGLDDTANKLEAFKLGADDYLIKPYNTSELIARIRAIVRRSKPRSQSVVQVGDMTLDLEANTVRVRGATIHLTGKEFQILELMCLRKGKLLTKETFLDQLYRGMDEPDPKIIDVFICNLRKKLSAASVAHAAIRTVWGRGYVLDETSQLAA